MVISIQHMLKCSLASIAHFALTMIVWIQYAASRLRLAFHVLTLRRCLGGHPRRYWRVATTEGLPHRSRAKPAWIQREVLRLKALMPHSGCRKIANSFNRRFALARQMTVGKCYVSDTIRKHHYEIAILRRQIKNNKPKAVPHNL
jgi:hypothetical protein